jgi:uncharacterized protein (TIGR02588 family)
MADDEKSPNTSKQPQRPNWLSRLVSSLSAVVVLALFGLILWDAVHPDIPPAPRAKAGVVRRTAGRSHIDVEVLNDGDMAARDVLVRVALATADTTIDDEITIDWLAGHSRRHVTVILPVADSARVTADVEGFVTP